jgi:hypothetical protein
VTVKAKTKILPIAEIRELFPNQWVLLDVKRLSWRTGNLWGRVLFASPNEEDLIEPAQRLRAENPDLKVGYEFTGPLIDPEFDGIFVL